jgi:hypothetical protein
MVVSTPTPVQGGFQRRVCLGAAHLANHDHDPD